MSTRIEFHILQSFAPSNLNRDDTGSPKDAVFGGVRRGRISSQSLKRATRFYMKDHGLVPPHAASHRSKRVTELLATKLQERDVGPEDASAMALNVLGQVGSQQKLKVKASKSGESLTEYLMFLGEAELNEIADVLAPQAQELKDPKSKAQAAAGAVVTDILKKKGAGAVDVALYGRMLANLPEGNADASCQVAHAISTHRVDREFDYYTAVDDLKPDDNSGADMIGTIEFNSSVYYRYSVVDVTQLEENLGGDKDLTKTTVAAYTRAVAEAAPSGKQNTFAAHNLPSAILVTLRRSRGPRNLANAFEKPVGGGKDGLVSESVKRLAVEWQKTDEAYGRADEAWVLDLTGDFEDGAAKRVSSLDALVEAVRSALV